MRIGGAFLILIAVGGIATPDSPFEIPASLRAEIRRLGCAAPRDEGGDVSKGEFRRARITDWAVLCAKGTPTALMVFSGEADWSETELSKTYQGDGQHLAKRRIVSVDREYIMAHCKEVRGKLPVIDHQGILDTFNGSVVHYFYHGKWLDLAVDQ
jgi:hypothetical protein